MLLNLLFFWNEICVI